MKLTSAEGQQGATCTPETCSPQCALEVIDEILRARDGDELSIEEVDCLLDLRWVLAKRHNAERAVVLFCTLRRHLEEQFYLSFYRLRRWLENQIEAHIQVRRGEPERIVPLKIERHCPEAVRYQSLETVRQPGEPLQCPKVSFFFRCPHPAHPGRQLEVPCPAVGKPK